MKLKFSHLLSILLLFSMLATRGYGQNGQGDSFLASTSIPAGVKLAKSKKFDQARTQFALALNYWQHHPTAKLYLHILDDLDHGLLKKKTVQNIFKAVYEGQKGSSKNALKKIKKLRKKNSGYFPLLLMQADAEISLENPGRAEAALTEATKLTDQSVLPLLFRGRYYAADIEHQKAIADFSKALAIDPESAICLFDRGFSHAVEKDYDAAIRDFEAAISAYPAWGKSTVIAEAYFNRGVAASEKKKYRGAIKDFDQVVRINPDYLDSYLNRGIAYRNLRKSSKAMLDFNHCLAQDPNFVDAYYQRALIHFNRDKYSKAIPDLSKAADLRPRNRRILFKLAESYYKSGRYEKALVNFNKVIRLDKNYYWAYYWKGFSAEYSKKPKVALLAFQSFLARAPKRYYKQISHAEVAIQKLKMKAQ